MQINESSKNEEACWRKYTGSQLYSAALSVILHYGIEYDNVEHDNVSSTYQEHSVFVPTSPNQFNLVGSKENSLEQGMEM